MGLGWSRHVEAHEVVDVMRLFVAVYGELVPVLGIVDEGVEAHLRFVRRAVDAKLAMVGRFDDDLFTPVAEDVPREGHRSPSLNETIEVPLPVVGVSLLGLDVPFAGPILIHQLRTGVPVPLDREVGPGHVPVDFGHDGVARLRVVHAVEAEILHPGAVREEIRHGASTHVGARTARVRILAKDLTGRRVVVVRLQTIGVVLLDPPAFQTGAAGVHVRDVETVAVTDTVWGERVEECSIVVDDEPTTAKLVPAVPIDVEDADLVIVGSGNIGDELPTLGDRGAVEVVGGRHQVEAAAADAILAFDDHARADAIQVTGAELALKGAIVHEIGGHLDARNFSARRAVHDGYELVGIVVVFEDRSIPKDEAIGRLDGYFCVSVAVEVEHSEAVIVTVAHRRRSAFDVVLIGAIRAGVEAPQEFTVEGVRIDLGSLTADPIDHYVVFTVSVEIADPTQVNECSIAGGLEGDFDVRLSGISADAARLSLRAADQRTNEVVISRRRGSIETRSAFIARATANQSFAPAGRALVEIEADVRRIGPEIAPTDESAPVARDGNDTAPQALHHSSVSRSSRARACLRSAPARPGPTRAVPARAAAAAGRESARAPSREPAHARCGSGGGVSSCPRRGARPAERSPGVSRVAIKTASIRRGVAVSGG